MKLSAKITIFAMSLRSGGRYNGCSIRNKEQLEKSEKCGCFSCCEIFPPSEITDYFSDEEPTALCPYCYIDSVIGDASSFPITPKFLRDMRKRWF